jgi:hypothetical protein
MEKRLAIENNDGTNAKIERIFANVKTHSIALGGFMQTVLQRALALAKDAGYGDGTGKWTERVADLSAAPGKFEAEPWYTPYFYECALNGDGEPVYSSDEDSGTLGDIFGVDDEEREALDILPDIQHIALWYSDQGFVSLEELSASRYAEICRIYDL